MPDVTGSESFYRDLRPFEGFVEGAFEPAHYSPLPDDWVLLVADITGSTRAVAAGRYAEVNYLGAACIVALTNALGELELPTVFGGDGATAAVPPTARTAAVSALLATRAWGRASFDLELRVGAVPMHAIRARGASLEVAKMAFSPGNTMAMFRGNGFDLADDLVKSDDGTQGFLLRDAGASDAAPDLSDLSCRWARLPTESGTMLCLIIAASASGTAAADRVYREALGRLDAIVGLGSAHSSPVKSSNLRMRLSMASMAKEVKSRGGTRVVAWFAVAVRHVAQWLTFRLRLRPGGFDPERYLHETAVNADFRKVNGKLRLIVDCSHEDADTIEASLDEMAARGALAYGAHRTPHAIMTCVTPNVMAGEHVHYIDGGDGGLWRAAAALKARARE